MIPTLLRLQAIPNNPTNWATARRMAAPLKIGNPELFRLAV
jgi:hypothetical protein